jgi:hypothetical protein
MLKNPAEYERDTLSAKFEPFLAKFLPASFPDVSAGICQRALVDKTIMIRTQIGTRNRSEMAAVHGTLCVIQHSNSKQYSSSNVLLCSNADVEMKTRRSAPTDQDKSSTKHHNI